MMKETDEETTEEEKVEEQTFDRKYGKETYIQADKYQWSKEMR